jgi:hypothetical protein
MKITSNVLEDMLTAVKGDFDGGFCYLFAGPVPATAAEALDMGADHTQLAMLSVDNDGVTGLTFNAPVAGVLSKTGAEVWEGLVAFDGAEDTETTLTPTFFRFCPSGDDGRDGTGTLRIQGSVGGPASSAEMKLEGDTLTDNGSNTAKAASFNVRLTPVA